jgi:hypothetical protein
MSQSPCYYQSLLPFTNIPNFSSPLNLSSSTSPQPALPLQGK